MLNRTRVAVRRAVGVGIVLFAVLLLGACERNDGTFEEAGEKIDEAAENAREKTQEAAEEVGDALEDAADDLEDALDPNGG